MGIKETTTGILAWIGMVARLLDQVETLLLCRSYISYNKVQYEVS